MATDLPPLVTVADLADYRVDTTETDLIERLIDVVSTGIREAAKAPISRVASTVDIYGKSSAFLDVYGGPLIEVSEVSFNGKHLDDFKVRDGKLWRRSGWGSIEDDITVTFTHGWDPVPADVVKLAVNLIAAGLREATSEDGLASRRGLVSRQESIDDYSNQESYVRGEDEVIDLTEIPDRTREWLQRRFSSQAYVTGEY